MDKLQELVEQYGAEKVREVILYLFKESDNDK